MSPLFIFLCKRRYSFRILFRSSLTLLPFTRYTHTHTHTHNTHVHTYIYGRERDCLHRGKFVSRNRATGKNERKYATLKDLLPTFFIFLSLLRFFFPSKESIIPRAHKENNKRERMFRVYSCCGAYVKRAIYIPRNGVESKQLKAKVEKQILSLFAFPALPLFFSYNLIGCELFVVVVDLKTSDDRDSTRDARVAEKYNFG